MSLCSEVISSFCTSFVSDESACQTWRFKLQPFPRCRGSPKISKVGHVTPSQPVNGGCRWPDGDPIFGFLDPDMPIHYTTFIGLRWRLSVVYRPASPLLRPFWREIFKVPSKIVEKFAFWGKMGWKCKTLFFGPPKGTSLHETTSSQAAQSRCTCKAHAKINKNMGNATPCKIVTPKNSSWNFAHVISSASLPTMQILVSIGTVGDYPWIGELLPNCDFFDCPVLSCPNLFFSILHPGRTAGPIFMLDGSNDVFPCKDGPFGG